MNPAGVSRALVLAAGRGARMGAFSADRPKCLCPIAGEPIVAWTVRALRANGVHQIAAVGGWQQAQLIPWFDPLFVNAQWTSSNMVRSLLCASDWLRQAPTLIVYGDGAYGRRAIAAALTHDSHDLLVPIDTDWRSLWQRRFADPLSDAESLTRAGTRLIDIGRRGASLDQIEAQFMGLLKVSCKGWDRLSAWLEAYEKRHGALALDQLDFTAMLQGLIADGEPVHCVDVAGGWVEIDSESDRLAVEAALQEVDFSHDFRN